MRTLGLLFIFFFSYAVEAKKDWCDFNTEFATVYAQARTALAQATRSQRAIAQTRKDRLVITGSKRSKNFSDNWSQASLTKIVKESFPNEQVRYLTTPTGKVLIRPQNMREGQKYRSIVYDTSGDYFRIEVGTFRNGKLHFPKKQSQRYLSKSGEHITRPSGMRDNEWTDYLMGETHFKALP